MPDIFDEVAPNAGAVDIFDEIAPEPTRDIFDEVAPEPAPKPELWQDPEVRRQLDQAARLQQGFQQMTAGDKNLLTAIATDLAPNEPTPQEIREQEFAKRAGVTPIPMGTRVAAGVHTGLQQAAMWPRIFNALMVSGLDTVGLGNTTLAQQNRAVLAGYAGKEADIARRDQATFGDDIAQQLASGTGRAVAELPLYLGPGAVAKTPQAALKVASAAGGVMGGGTQLSQDLGAGMGTGEALPYAVASGLITALTTRAFGATGAESVFRQEGIQGIRARLLDVLKQSGLEGAEEAADQMQQDILERWQRNPDKPIDATIKEVLMAGAIGGIVGGGVSGVGNALGAAQDMAADQARVEAGSREAFAEARNQRPVISPQDQGAKLDLDYINRQLEQEFDARAQEKPAEPTGPGGSGATDAQNAATQPRAAVIAPSDETVKGDIFDQVASEAPPQGLQAESAQTSRPVAAGAPLVAPDASQQAKVRAELEQLPGDPTAEGRVGAEVISNQSGEGVQADNIPATKADLKALAEFIEKGGPNPFAGKPAETLPQKGTEGAKGERDQESESQQRSAETTALGDYVSKHGNVKGSIPARTPYLPTRDANFAAQYNAAQTAEELRAMGQRPSAYQRGMEDVRDAIANGERLGYRPEDIAEYLKRNYITPTPEAKSPDVGRAVTSAATGVDFVPSDEPAAGKVAIKNGDLVSVVTRTGAKAKPARVVQLQPDGSASVRLVGEKTVRFVNASQIEPSRRAVNQQARADELAGFAPEQQKQIKQRAAEFKTLVAEYAPQLDWAPPEAFDSGFESDTRGQAFEKADLRNRAIKQALRRVYPQGQENSQVDLANALPALERYLQEQFPGDNSVAKRRVLEDFGRREPEAPTAVEQSDRARQDDAQLQRIAAQNPAVAELRDLRRVGSGTSSRGSGRASGSAGQLGGNTRGTRRISAAETKALQELDRIHGTRTIIVDTPGDAVPFNGYKDRRSNVILIHARTDKPLLVVAGHELLHHIRLTHPTLYEELRAALWPLMQNTGDFRLRLERRGQGKADVEEELLADFLGDNLARQEFWETLKQRDPNLFRRLARVVKAWLDKLITKLKGAKIEGFGSEQYFSDLTRARDLMAWLLVEAGRETQFRNAGIAENEEGGMQNEETEAFSKPETGGFFDAVETVGEQRERLAREEREKRSRGEKEQMQARAAQRLTGADVDTTGEMFGAEVRQDKAGQGSLFSKPEKNLAAEQINRRTWWHVKPKDAKAYQKRGKFFASSQRDAEFYAPFGPAAEAQTTEVTNPLVGDERYIENKLLGEYRSGSLDVDATGFYEKRADLDREIAVAAKNAGYDSVALLTSKGWEDYQVTGRLPRSVELNTLESLVGPPPRDRQKNFVAVPPIKWAGGKRWLVPKLRLVFATYQNRRLVEPFFGSGAVTIGLNPAKAMVNDVNPQVINLYREIAKGLQYRLKYRRTKEDYLKARSRINELIKRGVTSGPEMAQLFYYINKTGFNGMWRVNSDGQLNTPFGTPEKQIAEGSNTTPLNPDFSPWRDTFRNVEFQQGDFSKLKLEPSDFVYADPPYWTAYGKRGYDKDGFTWEQQQKVAEWLGKHQGPVIISNSDSPQIVELYQANGFNIVFASRRGTMNSDTTARQPVQELIAYKNLSQEAARPLTEFDPRQLFSKPEQESEFARVQGEIAAAEKELMAAIRQHMNPPQGMTKAQALAAKDTAAQRLHQLFAQQLKLMTDPRQLDIARSPEETAKLISETVDLLNSIQDDITQRATRGQEIPPDVARLRTDLQERLRMLKGWTDDQMDEAVSNQKPVISRRDDRFLELESASDPEQNTLPVWKQKLALALRFFTSPIPELPLTGPRAASSALFRRGYRLFEVENNRVRKEAAEKVKHVIAPLADLGRQPADNVPLQRYYKLHNQLKRAEMYPDARAAIKKQMRELEEKHLNKDPFNLFRRLVLYKDFAWRATYLKNEAGKPITLPLGLTVEDVQAELARTYKAIEQHPDGLAITEALRRHYALTDELQKSILEHGEIIPESLRNPLYFPHHIQDNWTGRLDRVRPKTEEDFRRYLIAPTGSAKLIQSDYLKAMYLHTADVLAHNARVDLVKKYWQPYDISEQLKSQHGEAWTMPWNMPPGYKLFAPFTKLPLRMDYILSREVLADKLGVLFNDGDLRARLGESGKVLKVKPEDLHQALVAGEKIQWALPEEIVAALNGIEKREKAAANPGLGNAIGAPFRGLNTFWKKTKLFAPWNWIRYEYGNLSTDAIDKVLAADPAAAKYLPRAARELWESSEPGAETSPEFKAAAREGVFDTITAAEAGELTRMPEFKAFLTPGEARWSKVRDFLERPMQGSKFREGTFRFAKFLADVERLRRGEHPVYAGAFHRDIEALGEDVDGQRRMLDGEELIYAKAAEISLKTYGDYAQLGVVGQWLRTYAVPFWSWQDVNFRYHANQIRNLADGLLGQAGPDITSARKAALRYAGVRVVSTLVAIGIAKELWNQFGGPMLGLWGDDDDLEANLSEADRRRGHLLLGKDENGKTLVVYTPSAWSDVAEWVGGQNMKRLFMEWARGQITLEQWITDYAKQLPGDVLNKAAQSVGPLFKAPYELASGRATFPDVLDQRSIPDAEKWWRLVGTLTDDRAVNVLRGVFDQDYYSQPAKEQLQQIILQIRRRDPEQWAYYEAREDASDWKEQRTGKRYEAGSYNAPEAQALRNFRKAIYRGDVEAAERFYTRLLEFGYTAERLDASIRSQHPLADLNQEERAAYKATLTERQRRELELAEAYYSRIKTLDRREKQLFPSKRKPNQPANPALLRQIVEQRGR